MPNVGLIVSAPVAVVQHSIHAGRVFLRHGTRVVVVVRTHAQTVGAERIRRPRGEGVGYGIGERGRGGGGDVIEMQMSKRGSDT